MPVKRISLQLRTKTTEAQPAVSNPPRSPPHSSQENTQSSKAEPLAKGRLSRLKPTVPLHMTTRRHRSELDSTIHTTQPDNRSTKLESCTQKIQQSTLATTTSIVPKMPPKRINSAISEVQDSDENMKKRLRGSQSSKANGVSYSMPPSAPKEANDTTRADPVKPVPTLIKRPRGRPPLRRKPSLPSIEKVDVSASTATVAGKESPLVLAQIATEPKSLTPSRAPSDIVRQKVPRETLVEQYHHKQQLAMKHATTEQLRRRQARIQQQYNLLGQLAKKNNTFLIDKSIEILKNVSDVDLARTEWAASILVGLEKAEDARVEQIHFEKKIGLINAFHGYDAERQRIQQEYGERFLEIQEVYMGRCQDEIERIRRDHDQPKSPPLTKERPTPAICTTCSSPGTGKLDALAVLAQECEQHHRMRRKKTGVFHEAIAAS